MTEIVVDRTEAVLALLMNADVSGEYAMSGKPVRITFEDSANDDVLTEMKRLK